METDDDSLNQEHIYEIGAWSKFLDKSIPKIFQSSINIEDYIKAHDNEDENSLIDLESNQNKKIKVTEEFTKSFVNTRKALEVNGWSYTSTEKIRRWKNELAFNYLINYHYMFRLKKRESTWSWILILLSTFCSTLTAINISDLNISFIIKYVITVLSMIISLIAAYMKKENFVERIKQMDRYIQKVGFVNINLEGILQSKPWNRITYNEFNDKYYKEIVELFSYPPPMSPTEFKQTIYELTVYNPELVMQQIPWFEMRKIENIEYYHMTEFGYEVIKSHMNNMNCVNLRCCLTVKKSCFLDYDKYNRDKTDKILAEQDKTNTFKKNLYQKNKDYSKFCKEINISIEPDSPEDNEEEDIEMKYVEKNE